MSREGDASMLGTDCADADSAETDGTSSDNSLRRLESRARLFEPLTDQMFRQCGLGPGMRVLDVGCGTGDAALLASRFVGSRGVVVGIDASGTAVATARQRALERGASNVTFVRGSLGQYSPAERFDAVIGRFVLMHQPDPVATVWRLATLVRDGGILAFQEFDFTQRPLVRPELRLAVEAFQWITATLAGLGVDIGMGMRLHQTLVSAGLPRPSMLVGAAVESGADSAACELIGDTVSDLLEPMITLGVATPDEVGAPTLASRIRQAALETDAVIVSPYIVSAWTRVQRRPTGDLELAETS